MTIIEANINEVFGKELRHHFVAKSPAGDHVVASGNAQLALTVGRSDDEWEEYEVRAVVGPWWRDVQTVVPYVAINGFHNDDWDEVDAAGWVIRKLTWDTVGGNEAPHIDEERIRLKFHLGVKGEESFVMSIGYYFTARGRNLGVKGINSP